MANFSAPPPIWRAARSDPSANRSAEPLAPGDLVNASDHGRRVAETQVQAVRILGGEQAVLEALHSEGDGCTGGDGIKGVHVAQFVRLADRTGSVPAEQAGACRGLIFGAAEVLSIPFVVVCLTLAIRN
ncbi:MAG: hypothetical protein MZV70_65640, partial [Desulfobacterales bacterium]|nr:hypothetical protein [Desulfobacterales bacterium]